MIQAAREAGMHGVKLMSEPEAGAILDMHKRLVEQAAEGALIRKGATGTCKSHSLY